MPRNPMQDIVPKGRSIRNIPLPESRPKTRPAAPEPVEREEEPKIHIKRERAAHPRTKPAVKEKAVEEEVHVPVHRTTEEESGRETLRSVREEFESRRARRSGKSKKVWAIPLAVIVVLGLAIGISSVFHSATLLIAPRALDAAVNDDLVARKSASSGLSYQIVTVKEVGSETVRATGQEQVSRKATGTIVVYNDYNSTPQRLIKNTRFQTPEGLVFRITDSVTVPGKKGTTPGSVEATVVADEPGDSYNVGLKDFTIPGFKGDPRYTSFYARSKTPLAGGFVGMVKVIAESERKKAEANIESRLKTALLAKAPSVITPDKVAYERAYSFDFTTLPEEASGDNAVIKKEGTLSIALIDKGSLSAALAEKRVKGYNDEPVLITEIEKLVFTPKGDFRPAASESIVFNLAGQARFEWLYDEESLKKDLAGQSRSAIPGILQRYPTIEKADISLRPFWSRSFPESLDKITVRKGEK